MQGPVTLVLFAVVLEVLVSQAHSGQLVAVVDLDPASLVHLEKVKLESIPGSLTSFIFNLRIKDSCLFKVFQKCLAPVSFVKDCKNSIL